VQAPERALLARIATARPSAGLNVALGRCVQLLTSGFSADDDARARADHASVVTRFRAADLGKACRTIIVTPRPDGEGEDAGRGDITAAAGGCLPEAVLHSSFIAYALRDDGDEELVDDFETRAFWEGLTQPLQRRCYSASCAQSEGESLRPPPTRGPHANSSTPTNQPTNQPTQPNPTNQPTQPNPTPKTPFPPHFHTRLNPTLFGAFPLKRTGNKDVLRYNDAAIVGWPTVTRPDGRTSVQCFSAGCEAAAKRAEFASMLITQIKGGEGVSLGWSMLVLPKRLNCERIPTWRATVGSIHPCWCSLHARRAARCAEQRPICRTVWCLRHPCCPCRPAAHVGLLPM